MFCSTSTVPRMASFETMGYAAVMTSAPFSSVRGSAIGPPVSEASMISSMVPACGTEDENRRIHSPIP